MTPEERAEFDRLLASDPLPWRPLNGPQTDAYLSEADVVGYGGAAGGGKTDLCCGLATTQHQRVGIFGDDAVALRFDGLPRASKAPASSAADVRSRGVGPKGCPGGYFAYI